MRRAGVPAAFALLLALALLTSTAPAAADDPPHAHHRLDRVSAALAEDPLFVDPDVGHALGKRDRDRVRRAIRETARRLGTPAYVVVIPNPTASESQGRDKAFLFALHERSGRDGLYLMVNSYGGLTSEAFRVPRRYRYSVLDEDEPGSSRPPDDERRFDGLAERIVQRLNGYATAPTASPTMPTTYSTPDPFGEENRLTPAEPEISGPFFTGLLVAGPVAAVLLYWAGLAVLALVRAGRPSKERRRTPRFGRPGAKPGMRRLRRQAAKDVARLREALVTTEAEQGRRYAVSAYDAAQILYDDAKDDEERAIDLVGAIVLARQGLLALLRDTDSPPVPCLVNPLHGESAARRRLTLIHDDALPHRAPLCASCADRQERFGVTEASLLRIPGPGGRRPHLAVPGVWRDTAWGARGRKNFLPRVMRYLGVD